MRRVIAQRMSEAKRNIPHFSYVEEVDVTELEALRQYLNGKREGGRAAAHLPAFHSGRIGARARGIPRLQRALRCRARCDRAPQGGTCRHRHADARRTEGPRGSPRRIAVARMRWPREIRRVSQRRARQHCEA